MFTAPAIILGIFLAAAAGYLMYDILVGRRAAVLDAVRSDPADYVHARINEEAPHQFDLNRKVTQAQGNLTEAQGKATELGKDLPSDPPPRKWVITTLAFTAMWAVAFVVQLLLDFRIAKAITGNTGAAALTSLVVSGLLSAIPLAAALLWEKRSTLARRQVVLGILAAAALMFAVISIIVTLAPKRAELDYAERIDTAQQQLTMFNEDGDTTAAALTQTTINRLKKQRDQARTFYQAAAVAAGLLEGGASLAVPSGYLLVNYYGAQGLVRRRTKEATNAQGNVARRRERFAARTSRTLERAGIPQDRLGPLLKRTGGPTPEPPANLGNPPRPLAGTAGWAAHHEEDPRTLPGQRRPTGQAPAPQPTDTGSKAGDDDAPDPSFDQA
jgi:hypothetical protein